MFKLIFVAAAAAAAAATAVAVAVAELKASKEKNPKASKEKSPEAYSIKIDRSQFTTSADSGGGTAYNRTYERLKKLWTCEMKLEEGIFESIKFSTMYEAFANADKVDNYKSMLKILTNFYEESLLREKETGLTKKQMLVVLIKVTRCSEKFLSETIDQYPSLKKAMLFIIERRVKNEERDKDHTDRLFGADEQFCYKMELFKSILPVESPLKPRIDILIKHTREQTRLRANNNVTLVYRM
jgi:hypothetical protein